MALTDNLISYYKLDENAANTTVSDSHGSNDGTSSTNTSNLYDASGVLNSCFDFTASSSERISLGTAFRFTGAFSVSLWVKFTETANKAWIGNVGNLSHNTDGWVVMTAGQNIYLQINNGTSYQNNELQVATTAGNYGDGNFRHVVVTYDGSSNASGVTIYVNGSSVATNADSDTLSGSLTYANTTYIGAVNSGSYTDATIDEIGVWDKELTSSEVTQLYNSGSGLEYPFSSDITVNPSAISLSTTNNEPIYLIDVGLVSINANLNVQTPTITGTSIRDTAVASGTIGTGAIRNDVYFVNGVATYGNPYDNYNDTG